MRRYITKQQQTKNSSLRRGAATEEERQRRVAAAATWRDKYGEYARQGTVPAKWVSAAGAEEDAPGDNQQPGGSAQVGRGKGSPNLLGRRGLVCMRACRG